jgi:hypothetical protein
MVFLARFSARAGGVNDGVIFDTADPQTLAKWKRARLPRVQVMDSGEPFSVNSDEPRIGALATEQLDVPAAVDGRCVEHVQDVTLFLLL